ncbi:MAG: macrolide ABC transporter ATP-binding protein, partial [Planctomycetota bacterium]
MIDDEPYVIELDRITKTYGNNEILVTAIDEMDLKIKSKSFMAIMGQS